MDVLTDVLEAVRLKGTVLGRLELTAPWGLQSDGGCSALLVVTRGTCWLDVKGIPEPLQLAGGDLVLLTGSKGHTLRDNRRTRAVPFADVCRTKAGQRSSCRPEGIFHHGGGGALTTIIGGRFDLEDADPLGLIAALPPVIHVKGDRGTHV